MKKLLITTSIAALSVLGAVSYVHAEESQANRFGDIQGRIENRQAKIASTTEAIRARMEEKRDKIASTTNARIAQFDAKMKERLEKRASTTAALRAHFEERKEKLATRFTEGAAKHIAKAIDTLNAALERLARAHERISARIETLKAKNVDTSKAETLLDTAQTKVIAAKDKIANLSSIEGTLSTSTMSTSTRTQIKVKITEARDAVKAAHKAYVDVITELKPGYNKATSTTPAN